MHSFPICSCIACVLAERECSAYKASLSLRAHGRPRLAAPPHRSRRAGAPSPRFRAAPRPLTDSYVPIRLLGRPYARALAG
eukprot:2141489-Pleurochrysis_carterae.AAC.1